jgi:tetratricopeptide (TPR) repeat protein
MSFAITVKQLIKQAKDAENKGNYQEAEVLWLRVIQQKPDNAQAHIRLAKSLFYQNKTEAALIAYEQALKLQPSPQISTNLGIWLLEMQKLKEAIAVFHQAIALEPNCCYNEYRYRMIATALIQQGKLDDALAICHQVIALNYGLETCLITGYAIYDAQGFSAVMAAFRQFAAKVSPKPMSGLYYRLGGYIELHFSDRKDEAIAAFRETIRLNPDHQHAIEALNKLQQNTPK